MIIAEVTTVSLVLAIAGMLLSAAGMLLGKKKIKSPLRDEVEETQIDPGGWLPLVIGRGKVAPVLAYISAPFPQTANAVSVGEGGKRQGPSGSAAATWQYDILHLVCVAPIVRLNGIDYNGAAVTEIAWGWTPETMPFGTVLPFSAVGSPVGYLAFGWEGYAPALYSINNTTSDFPLAACAAWTLVVGDIRQIPDVRYDVTCLPVSRLLRTASWRQELIMDGAGLAVMTLSARTTGPVGVRTVTVANGQGAVGLVIQTGDVVYLAGTVAVEFGAASTTGDYFVVWLGNGYPGQQGGQVVFIAGRAKDLGYEITSPVTRTATPSGVGTMVHLSHFRNGGVNGGHLLSQLMFAPWPWGAGMRRDFWSVESLESLGEVIGFEDLRCGITVAGGETAKAVVGEVLQDLGAAMSWNPLTGKNELFPLRNHFQRALLPSKMLSRPLPEVTNRVGRPRKNAVVFAFEDATRRFRKNTFFTNSEGVAVEVASEGVDDTARIRVTSDPFTAQLIAIRREVEVLGQMSPVTVNAGRGATLIPQALTVDVEGLSYPVRVIGVTRNPLTDRVELECLRDPYHSGLVLAATSSGFIAEEGFTSADVLPSRSDSAVDQGGGIPAADALAADPIVMLAEVPRLLQPELTRARVAVLRVRSSTDVLGASVHGSLDGTTYSQLIADLPAVPGGTLVGNLPSSGKMVITDGSVVVSPLGPDWAALPTVTSDQEWHAGRLLMIIKGKEVCFVRGATLSGGNRVITDVIRARYGTQKGSWSAGDKVVLVEAAALRFISGTLVQPGRTLYVKTRPKTGSRVAPLSAATAETLLVAGLQLTPLPLANLRSASLAQSWVAGGNLVVRWDAGNPAATMDGAGLQGYGDPVGTQDEYEGEFVLRAYDADPDTTGVLKRTVDKLKVATYTYAQASIASDFGGEPSTLWLRVEHVRGGFRSGFLKKQFTRI